MHTCIHAYLHTSVDTCVFFIYAYTVTYINLQSFAHIRPYVYTCWFYICSYSTYIYIWLCIYTYTVWIYFDIRLKIYLYMYIYRNYKSIYTYVAVPMSSLGFWQTNLGAVFGSTCSSLPWGHSQSNDELVDPNMFQKKPCDLYAEFWDSWALCLSEASSQDSFLTSSKWRRLVASPSQDHSTRLWGNVFVFYVRLAAKDLRWRMLLM